MQVKDKKKIISFDFDNTVAITYVEFEKDSDPDEDFDGSSFAIRVSPLVRGFDLVGTGKKGFSFELLKSFSGVHFVSLLRMQVSLTTSPF